MTGAAPLHVEEISDPARFGALEGPWNDLLAESDQDLPFLRHEWLRLWWKHFGAGRKLAVLLLTRGDRFLLAAPLMEVPGRILGARFVTLQSMTNEHSYRFDLIQRHGEEEAIPALWRYLRGRSGWSLVQLRDVVWPGASAEKLHRAAHDAGHPTGLWLSYESPYLAPGGTFAEYRDGLRAKFRSNLRNRTKRLRQRGAIAFDVVEDPERALRLLSVGLAIERSGWKGEQGSAIACDPVLTGFYTDWATLAAERGWLRLQFLRVADRYVAFDYSVRYKDRLYCLKIGYEAETAPWSTGQLLKERILERTFADGFREYDFLGAMTAAKADWKPRTRRHAWLFAYNTDPLSRAAHAGRFALRPMARRLLHR